MDGKKKLGSDLPADEVDRFNKWADQRGYVKKAATLAAIRLLPAAPQKLLDAAMRKDWASVELWFDRANHLIEAEPGIAAGELRKAVENGGQGLDDRQPKRLRA